MIGWFGTMIIKGGIRLKSSYNLAMTRDESGSNDLQSGFSRGLKRMWALKNPKKIKIHAWQHDF